MLLALGMRVASKASQRSLNTVTTNVPGPQHRCTSGRRDAPGVSVRAAREQVRIGVAIFSYNGQLNYGVTGDYDTAPDIAVLCRGIEKGLADLLASPEDRAAQAGAAAYDGVG